MYGALQHNFIKDLCSYREDILEKLFDWTRLSEPSPDKIREERHFNWTKIFEPSPGRTNTWRLLIEPKLGNSLVDGWD